MSRERGDKDTGTRSPFRCFRIIFSRIPTILFGAASLASAASSAFADWPAGEIGEVTLGVVAASLFGFHMLNFELRILLGHWSIRSILRPLCFEMALGCGVPAAILFAIFHSPPTWQLLAAISLALLATFAIYEPIQEEIRKAVKRENMWQGTQYFGTMHPLNVVGVPHSIEEMAKTQHGPNLQSLLAFFLGPPWIIGLSRTRTVILCLILAGVLAAATSAANVRIQEGNHSEHQKHGRTVREGKMISGGDGPTRSETEPGPPEGTAAGRMPEGECRHIPGYGAPQWASADLTSLYMGGADLNATPPPGLDVGGCPTGVVVPASEEGSFVYTIGKNLEGEIRSIAVDSTEFGPAIFLAPAAQRVIDLIERGEMPVGGYPRVNAGNGDMAPVLTPEGTVVLVRSSKHPPGKSNFATPYVELPPTVASAWVGAMHELDTWLWPRPPASNGGVETFALNGESDGREVRLVVNYQPNSGLAWRDSYTYDLPEAQLSQIELEQRARTALYSVSGQ